MSFREVQVHEIREVLRLWVRGESERATARLSMVDRKTVKRYVTAGSEAGLVRNGDEGQLTDGLIGQVCELVRPHRPDGHGAGWETCRAHHDQLKAWLVDEGLTVVKAHRLLTRRGVVVPQRTLHRYALEELGVGRSVRRSTVRIADGEPGMEVQIDFGKMGLLFDSVTGRRRVCWALIFTAVYSRHCFVWLSFNQTIETLIDGCEAAWSFFGGVFKVVIPENVPRYIFGDHHGEDTAKKRPRRLAPRDHRGGGLGEAQPHKTVPREHRGEDQRLDHTAPVALRVEYQTHLSEVHLQLHTGLPVGHPHRGPPSRAAHPEHLQGVALSGALRDDHAAPGEQLAGLDRRQTVVNQPALQLLVVGHQQAPRRTVAFAAMRAHLFAH